MSTLRTTILVRPRAVFLALVFAAVAAGCRKTQAPTPAAASEPAASRPATVEDADTAARTRRPAGSSPAVIWIGLDGLDFELVDRLAAEGKMPNWKRLAAGGYTARLSSFMPVLSPVIWTTAATGVGPDVHRVLDFQEVEPKSGRKVPVSGLSRAVPAAWNIASSSGKKVGVVGWWATHPAEEVNGFFISDHASPILYDKLPLSGVAFPGGLADGVAQVVARDGVVSEEDIEKHIDVPAAEVRAARASGAGMENPVVALSRILAQTRVYHRIARDLYDKNQPDLMVLYLQGTDEIAHVFAPYTAPKMACVAEADYARYNRAVPEYYALVDRMLGQWMRRAEEDGATLLVHSDHGFKWGEDRPCERSSQNWNTAAYWHRLDGVLAAWGPRVAAGKPRGKASVFDVAPTVLGLLGVAPDRRMRGRPMPAFSGLSPAAARDVFAGITVRRMPAEEMSEQEASEYAKKLVALGYISGSDAAPLAPTGGDRPGMTEGAWNNLGLYYRETSVDLPAAEQAFEKSLALRPNYHSPMFNLAVLHRGRGDWRQAEDWLFRSLAAGHADPEGTVGRWIAEYQQGGKAAAARSLLDRAVRTYPENEPFARELGLTRFKVRDCPGALAALGPFEAATSDPNTLNALGLFQTCLGRRDEAIRLFERSLTLKPDQPAVVQSLQVVRGGAPPGRSR
jgi:predicted AlkP superfamily phosphohydrolase/phosphomutase